MHLVRKRADPARAERIGRSIVELFPLHVESYELLIAAMIDLGRREQAIRLLETAVKLRRTPASMYVQLAKLLSKFRRHDEAIAHLRTALQLDPDNARAKSMMETYRAAGSEGADAQPEILDAERRQFLAS